MSKLIIECNSIDFPIAENIIISKIFDGFLDVYKIKVITLTTLDSEIIDIFCDDFPKVVLMPKVLFNLLMLSRRVMIKAAIQEEMKIFLS
jgi:hypothetical protein